MVIEPVVNAAKYGFEKISTADVLSQVDQMNARINKPTVTSTAELNNKHSPDNTSSDSETIASDNEDKKQVPAQGGAQNQLAEDIMTDQEFDKSKGREDNNCEDRNFNIGGNIVGPNSDRVSRMKMKRMKFEDDRKSIEHRQFEQRRAGTIRGSRVLRSRDAKSEQIQDKSEPLQIVGADVVSLYPSLDDKTVAEIVYNSIMNTEIRFDNVNFKEAVRYLALNWSKAECRTSPLRRVLPRRSSTQGTRPGMTGQGPLGPGEGRKEQWTFPRVCLTELEKRMIVASVMRVATLTMFNTHIYNFDNCYFLQQKGGPIGLRATCAVARLTMVEWDRMWLERITEMGLTVEEAARYMDDLRLYMYGIRAGWRWYEKELCWTQEWEDEDNSSDRTDLERTCEIVRCSLNMIYPFLNFTIESVDDFEDRRLPTLDFKMWVTEDNIVMYTFFEKPTSSNQMLHRNSALSENVKMATMNAEIIRRMMNVSELLPDHERITVLDRVAQKLCNSGYNLSEIRKGMVGALTGYERRVSASRNTVGHGFRPLHESSEASLGSRIKKKLTGKSTWFKGGQREQQVDRGEEVELSGKQKARLDKKERYKAKERAARAVATQDGK